MAVYPCDIGQHRYAGPQRSSYATLVRGTDVVSGKLRLCPNHYSQQRSVVREHLKPVNDEVQLTFACDNCGQKVAASLWVRLYGGQDEPEQYVGDFCAACTETTVAILRWTDSRKL